MINSTYRPTHKSQFESDKVDFDGKSISGATSESQTLNIELAIADDLLLTGGILLCRGAKWGDKVSFQVVHPVYGVVSQFVTDFLLKTDTEQQFNIDLEYPAKLSAGLSLRIKLVTTSEVGSRDLACNLYLHRCKV